MPITITEALAEIKTIGKRVEKKYEFIFTNLARQEGAKDPLERDGGSTAVLMREKQSIADLHALVIDLRRGIQRANDETKVTINDQTRTISEWLIWRRDVAPKRKEFFAKVTNGLKGLRENAKRQGVNVIASVGASQSPTDIVVNISEGDLAAEIERFEDTLGQLDGQLSLKNATVMIRE